MAYLFVAMTIWFITIAITAYIEYLALSKQRFYLIGYQWIFGVSGAIATLIYTILMDCFVV